MALTYTSPYSPFGTIGITTLQNHRAYGFLASFSGDWYFFSTYHVHEPSKLCQTSYASSGLTVLVYRFFAAMRRLLFCEHNACCKLHLFIKLSIEPLGL